MGKITITLKQHTPLLHFQPMQDGATLRASEVKPKLDKYIIEKCFKNDFDLCKKYLVGYNSKDDNIIKNKFFNDNYRALNYKMKIKTEDTSKYYLVTSGSRIGNVRSKPRDVELNKLTNTSFFAQEKIFKSRERFLDYCSIEKLGVLYEDITLTIFLNCSELKELISNNIADFFIKTNFGARQTKGFGSFTIPPSKNKHLAKHLVPSNYYFDIQGDDMQQLFQYMEWFYKTIRSGINDCVYNSETKRTISKLYFKSLLFSYAKKHGQQWDKKTIKENFYPSVLSRQQKEHNRSDILTFSSNLPHYDYKDCLGFSTIELWKNPYDKTIKKNSDNMERFQSPIILKPTYVSSENCWRIYVIPLKLPDVFYDVSINISDCSSNIDLGIDRDFSIQSYFDFLFKRRSKFVIDEKSKYSYKECDYNIDISKNFSKADRQCDKDKKEIILLIFQNIRERSNFSNDDYKKITELKNKK